MHADTDADFRVFDHVPEILFADAQGALGPLLLGDVGEGRDIAAVGQAGAPDVEDRAVGLRPFLALRTVRVRQQREAMLHRHVGVMVAEIAHLREMGEHVAQAQAVRRRLGRIVVQVEEALIAGDDPQILVEDGKTLVDRAQGRLEQPGVLRQLVLDLGEPGRIEDDGGDRRYVSLAVMDRELGGDDRAFGAVGLDEFVLHLDDAVALQDVLVEGERR